MPLLGALLLVLGLAACSAVREPARAPERRATSADGLAIAWEEKGSGAPALVFVHGWCGERAFWRGTMEALAPTHRVLALDLGGHGTSAAARERWTLASLADDLVAVVEASGAEDVILVGHSMGGPVALLAAPRLAPRVRGVIAVDSLHDADFAYPPGFLAGVADALEADFPGALAASLRGTVSPSAPPELLPWIESRALRTDRRAALGLLRGLGDFSLASALAAAGVPVRVINSASRVGAELETRTERNRELCDFDAILLEDTGHFPMLERPAAFRAVLVRWIAALSAPRAGSAP